MSERPDDGDLEVDADSAVDAWEELPPRTLEPRHAVASGLRVKRSETQVTQLLASVLGAEEGLAAQFVRLVVEASPGRRFAADTPIPADLVCKAEEVTPFCRFDLSFRSPSGACVVVVELKIHAEFAPNQIDNYLNALRVSTAPTRLLVAITRDTPRFGSAPPVAGPPAWLGCVSWATLLEGLRGLVIDDAILRDQWSFVLNLLEEEGAMGFTHAEPRYFDAWLHQRRAEAHLKDFVDALRVPVRDGVRTAVCADLDSPAWAGAADMDRGKGRGITVDRSGPIRVFAGLRLPQTGPVHVEFGVGSWDEIYLFVELSQLPKGQALTQALPVTRTLVGELAKAGFDTTQPKRRPRVRCDLTADRILSPDLPGVAAAWIVESINAARRAGAFDAAVPTTLPSSSDPIRHRQRARRP